jgi:hypothetical protein
VCCYAWVRLWAMPHLGCQSGHPCCRGLILKQCFLVLEEHMLCLCVDTYIVWGALSLSKLSDKA